MDGGEIVVIKKSKGGKQTQTSALAFYSFSLSPDN